MTNEDIAINEALRAIRTRQAIERARRVMARIDDAIRESNQRAAQYLRMI